MVKTRSHNHLNSFEEEGQSYYAARRTRKEGGGGVGERNRSIDRISNKSRQKVALKRRV